jgi:[acyl-carrier-protein] S-malonyltransferase
MKKIAFLFPGQGSQYVGMGERFLDSKIFSELFEEAGHILGYDLRQLCLDGSASEIADTEITQPAVFVTSVALFEYYKGQLPIPQFMAGHSLGEYTALACSGVLTFKEVLSIVKKRGKLMKLAGTEIPGAMLSINNLTAGILNKICADIAEKGRLVSVSASNSASQFTISGHTMAVAEAGACCEKSGAVVTELKVSAPFHCELMATAADELKAELQRYTYKTPVCKILSNLTGAPYTGVDDLVESLALQMRKPLRWTDCIDHLIKSNVQLFIEIGPGKVLRNLLRRSGMTGAYSVDDAADLEQLMEFLRLNIRSLSTMITKCLGISMSVRNNNYDPEEYLEGVVRPYRVIKDIQANIESKKALPTREDMARAASCFCTILNTKKVKYQEKLDRLDELFSEAGMKNFFALYVSHLN